MNKSSKVLVIGANSLLGTNVIIELLYNGFLVKGFLRCKNRFLGADHQNLELYEGDITNISDLNNATTDCEYIINCVAVTDQGVLEYEIYHKVNVAGVQNMFLAAVQNRVKRILQVGTANEFGYGNLSDLGDETKKMKYPFSKSLYARSKKEAYHFLVSKTDEIEIVFVQPTLMIGPYDSKPSSGKIVLMGLKSKFVFCPPGGKNFVCVKDVAIGMVKVLVDGNNGESYLLANENLSFFNFFKMLRNHIESKFYIIKIPKWVLISLGYLGSTLRLFKVKTSLSVENMQTLCVENYYTNQKAKTSLNLDFTPIGLGIKEAIYWFNRKH